MDRYIIKDELAYINYRASLNAHAKGELSVELVDDDFVKNNYDELFFLGSVFQIATGENVSPEELEVGQDLFFTIDLEGKIIFIKFRKL